MAEDFAVSTPLPLNRCRVLVSVGDGSGFVVFAVSVPLPIVFLPLVSEEVRFLVSVLLAVAFLAKGLEAAAVLFLSVLTWPVVEVSFFAVVFFLRRSPLALSRQRAYSRCRDPEPIALHRRGGQGDERKHSDTAFHENLS